jgi:hypothetical protein
MMKAITSILNTIVVLLVASAATSLGPTALAQGNQSQQQNQTSGGVQVAALGNESQLSKVLGNNTAVLSENTPIGNANVSTSEKMNREQTSINNKTEAKNMAQQQAAGGTAGKNQSQGNQTSQQQDQNTTQATSNISGNAINLTQQQGQNNTNPLSNIPILGELFGGK